MLQVISDVIAHWNEMINKIINTINFCNAMKMNYALCLLKAIIME